MTCALFGILKFLAYFRYSLGKVQRPRAALMVEMTRFELATPCLQSRCSPS